MGKYPSMSGGGTIYIYLPDVKYSHPHEEGPSLPIEVASYPPLKTTKNQNQLRNQNQQPEHEDVLAIGRGVDG